MIKDKLLIIGMSPGNGYFKQEVIDKLLVYCLEKYEKVGVFIPDVPAISTYVALGYPEDKARSRKAIPQGNNFRNRVKSAILVGNLNPEKIRIFDWDNDGIENNKLYRREFDTMEELYKNNSDFRQDINSETEKVLKNSTERKKEITEIDVETGAHYILSEFAFLLFILDYLPEAKGYTYGYHRSWPVWEKFIAGEYDGKKQDIKFLLLPDFSKSV